MLNPENNIAQLTSAEVDFVANGPTALQYKSSVTVGAANADFITSRYASADLALQAAVDHVGSAGGVITILPGTYAFNAAVQFGYSGITVEGCGKGATVLQANYNGTDSGQIVSMLNFSASGAAPISNGVIRNLSFDLQSRPTGAIYFRAVESGSSLCKNFLVEDVEIYARGYDSSGSFGAITAKAKYSDSTAGMRNVELRRVEIHDGIAGGDGTNGISVLFLSDDLAEVRLTDCYFHDTYGTTVGFIQSGYQNIRDVVFENCSFVNTQTANPWAVPNGFGDISENRAGFNGIRVSNCYFSNGSLSVHDIYCLKVYNSIDFVVTSSVFESCRSVIAPGYSESTGKETTGFIFSNNVIRSCYEFSDPDGHYAGEYSNNVFYNLSHGAVLGGYGVHDPSVYDGNLFYNCNLNPDTSTEYGQGLFLLEQGGNVVANNVIFDNTAATKLKYVFCEIYDTSSGLNSSDPNVYRNNTILGNGPSSAAFYLDDAFKHVIQDNSGLPEAAIQNHMHNLTPSTSALASTDMVSRNFTQSGTPTANVEWFGSKVGVGTGSPNELLDVAGTSPAITLRYSAAPTSSFKLLADAFKYQVASNSGTDTSPSWTTRLSVSNAGDVYLPTGNAHLFLGASSSGFFVVEKGATTGGSSTDLYVGETADTGKMIFRGSGATSFESKVGLGQATPTAAADIAASTTSAASMRLRSGTAPTSPNDGDVWYDGTNLKMRVGGTTKTFTLT